MNKIDNEGEPSTTVWQGPVVATNVLVAQETSILFPILGLNSLISCQIGTRSWRREAERKGEAR
jgi:hypothetical protein